MNLTAKNSEIDHESDSIAAIILAGGQSRRMGVSKAHLSLDMDAKRSLADIVLTCAQKVTREIVLVGGDPSLASHGVRSVPDDFPGQGPLGGLITGMRCIRSERAILLAIDMPFVDPVVMQRLVDLSQAGDTVALLRGDDEGVLEPFVALYTRRSLPHLETIWELGVRSLGKMLASLTVTGVPAECFSDVDPKLWSWFNVNTPDDLARARFHAQEVECSRAVDKRAIHAR